MMALIKFILIAKIRTAIKANFNQSSSILQQATKHDYPTLLAFNRSVNTTIDDPNVIEKLSISEDL